MRRLLCVFLCIILVYSLSVGAVATSSATTSGLHDAVPESVIRDDGTEYLVHVNEGETIYEPVARVSFSVKDADAIGNFLSNDVIPLEVREDVAEQVKKAAEVGNHNLGITVLSSSLYLAEQANTAIVSSNNTDDEYVNGALMRSEITTYTDIDTGYEYVDKGSATKDTMSNVSSILLSGLGTVKRISYLATGISLLSAFINEAGNIPTGHYKDFAQTRVVYDSTKNGHIGLKQRMIWHWDLFLKK